MFFQVTGRRDEAAFRRADAPRREVGIRELADANGDVESFFHQVHEAVRVSEIDHQARMHRLEFQHQRAQVHLAHSDGSIDAQHAGQLGLKHTEVGFRFIYGVENAFRTLEIGGARLGQRQLPGAAIEQPGFQMSLQRRQLLADGRLAHVHLARNRRKASGFDDAHEQSHCGQSVHRALNHAELE
jgi:hypothetical protein